MQGHVLAVAGGLQAVPGGVGELRGTARGDSSTVLWSIAWGASWKPRLGSFQIDQKATRGSGLDAPGGV